MVVLVHGLGAPAMMMRPMQHRFEAVGYVTCNFGYPSLVGEIQQHGGRLADVLADLASRRSFESIHLVTHSMGGIVTRCALQARLPPQLGRIVMLAPPNRGSPVATRLRPLAGRLVRPIDQLSQHAGSWISQLPSIPGVQVGVIAGAQDWVVGDNTHLPDEADHILIPAFHTPIVWQSTAFAHALHFLRHGRFARS